jgi:putative ABC transport system ATP-binding protein
LAKLNEEGRTIVMVTHEPDVAQHTRRTVVLRDGTLLSDERHRPWAPGSAQ